MTATRWGVAPLSTLMDVDAIVSYWAAKGFHVMKVRRRCRRRVRLAAAAVTVLVVFSPMADLPSCSASEQVSG